MFLEKYSMHQQSVQYALTSVETLIKRDIPVMQNIIMSSYKSQGDLTLLLQYKNLMKCMRERYLQK